MTESQSQEEHGKFLNFMLVGESYGIALRKVREIIGLIRITPIPQAPEYFKGVINLHGEVLPVIDLRLKLGLVAAVSSDETCIIIVEFAQQTAGVIVDRVAEVQVITPEEFHEPPKLGSQGSPECVMGLGRRGETVTVLLDLDRILTARELVPYPKAAPGDTTAA